MGRKKTKKSKSSHGGGHKRHVSNSQSEVSETSNNARTEETPAAIAEAPAPSMGQTVPEMGATAAPKEEPSPAIALTDVVADPPLASAKERESPSPPRQINRNANKPQKPKAVKRAQMQGQLNSLESELAVVEDLQARMAAKLNALDANLAEKEARMQEDQEATEEQEASAEVLESDKQTEASCPAPVEEKTEQPIVQSETEKKEPAGQENENDPAGKERENDPAGKENENDPAGKEKENDVKSDEKQTSKKKNKKKQKQDKAGKQEENMKEAQRTSCKGQFETIDKECVSACFCPALGDYFKEYVQEPELMGDIDQPKEAVIVENPDTVMEMNAEVDKALDVDSNKENIQPLQVKIVKGNVKESVPLSQEQELAKEIAKFLQMDCEKMFSVHNVLQEEMNIMPQILKFKTIVSEDKSTATPQSTPTPTQAVQFFSYADAVKSSLKAECEEQERQVCLEKAEAEFHDNKSSTNISEGNKDKEEQTYLAKYMKEEYQPCMRKLEAEEAEVFYYEALEKLKGKDSHSPMATPNPDVSVSNYTATKNEEVVRPPSHPKEDNNSNAVAISIAAEYEQLNARQSCMEAEATHQELLEKQNVEAIKSADEKPRQKEKQATAAPAKPKNSKEGSPDVNIIEVAKYLREESCKMENLHAALRSEESYREKMAEDRREDLKNKAHQPELSKPSDASKMTAMLEAATMEVEYDKVEEEFLIQREQKRQQPWRWVRADTAPAYINVPETVLEPTSDQEEEGEMHRADSAVQTDLAGMVFQCKDLSVQTEGQYVECCKCGEMALPWNQQFALRLQEEAAQRRSLENMVRLLEAEAADQRQRLFQQRKFSDELENSITDKKAEATEAKLLAMEYKSRCQDLEQSLDTARSVVNTLEEQASTCKPSTSDLDYMLEAKMNALKAKESQGKIDASFFPEILNVEHADGGNMLPPSALQTELEAKLALSKSEVQTLLDNLSDQNRHEDLIPVLVHQQQLDQVESRCYQLQLKVTQLEAELAKVQNVRDVWGSNQQGSSAVQGGSLDMAFQSLASSTHQPVFSLPPSVLSKTSNASVDLPPIANVDLPPVPSLHGSGAPGCLSGLRGIGSTPPGEGPALGAGLGDPANSSGLDCVSLSSGLLSGLSDLQAKSTPPVVAPLAMQEDMDSDDDVSWSSASEHLKDMSHSSGQSRASPAPGTPISPCFHSKSCLPHNSLHGQSVMLPTCMALAQQHTMQQSTGPVSHVSPRRMSPAGPVSHASPLRMPPGGPMSHVSPHRMSPVGPVSHVSPHSMPACRPMAHTSPHQMPHLTEGVMGVGSTDQNNSPPKPKANKKRNRSKKYSK